MKSPLPLRILLLCALSLNTGCYALQKSPQQAAQTLDTTELKKLIQNLISEDAYVVDETKTKLYLIGAPAVPGVIQLLQSKNSAHQMTALELLGILPGPEIKPALLPMLKDANPEIRKQTLVALAMSQGEGAFPALQDTLLHDEDPEVRQSAAQAVFLVLDSSSEVKAPALTRALAKALKDKNAEVREAAADVLSVAPPPGARGALIQALKDPAVEVRKNAVYALEKHGGMAVSEDLARAFDDPSVAVRNAVVRILGRIESPKFEDLAIQLSQDADPESRVLAIDSMATAAHPERFFSDVMKAFKDPNPTVRSAAMRAASRFDTWESVPALIAGVKDADIEVKRQALQSLGRLKSPEALPAIFEALAIRDDNDFWVRQDAEQAAIFILKPFALATYDRALRSKDPEVKAFAQFESDRLNSPLIKQAFSEGLQQSGPEVQKKLLTLTHGLLSPTIERLLLPDIINSLRSQDQEVRYEASTAMTYLDKPEAATAAVPILSELILAAKDNQGLYSSGLFSALEKIDEQAAVDLCLRMIEGKNPELMDEAIFELGIIKDAAAVPALIRVVEDTTNQMSLRLSAIQALTSIKAPEATPVIQAFLKAEKNTLDPERRAFAARNLAELGDLPSALPVFKQALDETASQGESDTFFVYGSVIDGLSASKDPVALPLLMTVLKKVRALDQLRSSYMGYVIKALQNIGGTASVTTLLEMIDREDSETALAAAQALGEMQVPVDFTPAIVERLLFKKEPYMQSQIESPELGEMTARDIIVGAFQDSYMIEALTQVLVKMESETALTAFVDATKKAHPETKAQLIEALGKFKPSPTSLSFLQQTLKASDAELRSAAYGALEQLADPATAPWLRSAYAKEDPESEARRAALEALARVHHPTDAPLFISLLKRDLRAKTFELNLPIVLALGAIGDAKAVGPLLEALDKTSDYASQALIAEALGKIGDPAALPTLKKSLRHHVSEDLKAALLTALLAIEAKNA